MSGHGSGWQEVGDRVFRFRYRSYDLNVGAVVGDDEVLVVDTRSWVAEATELLADLRRLTRLPCRQAVNTHWHFDHCFGNATLRPAAIWGHQRCAEQLRGAGEERRQRLMAAHPEVAEELAAMAALCRRVAAGELPADEAVRAAPFPAQFARDALALSARAGGPAGGAAPGTARPG